MGGNERTSFHLAGALFDDAELGVETMKYKKRSARHKAWDVFSKFIRKREANEDGIVSCFTCGTRGHWKDMDAGHYIPKSISLALRFHERNVHVQCTSCNRFRHGNLTQYALALKKRYGEEILEELDEYRRENEGMRISEPDYRALIERYESK